MSAPNPDAAVANGRAVNSYDSGMCQKFVRDQCWRVPSLYGSAIDAWNGARYKHPGDRTPPKGAPTYYRGGSYGHAVIWVGNNIRSTDCTSAWDVSEVAISWVESHWGYEYLGWTEDINGVRVIHDEEEDEMKQEDFERIRKIVNDEVHKAWEVKQQNEHSRNVNLKTAGNVRDIVRDELKRVGLTPKDAG